ncbi:tetratricopeptide repeat protein [Candidatus Njordibacter sp. Uisw_058]|uniref:tetratricopeptide repeat protein n=1 Tax=Candidatus Njordibacter sp. Uisw_058 TaxID=3230974 RepID=UPI003D3FEBCB
MKLTLEEALQKAVKVHKAGQIQEADRLYTAILKAQPKHPDANHNMGVLAVSVGKAQEALPFLKTALEANPSIGQYWLSYIDTMIKLDRIADAKAVLEQAKGKGAKGESFEKLERLIAENGLKITAPDKLKVESPTITRQKPPSKQLQPIVKLYTQGQWQQALYESSQMLEQFPNSAHLCNIAGGSSLSLMQIDAAIKWFKQALNLEPNSFSTHVNLGMALRSKGDLEAAIISLKQGLKIMPNSAEANNNMGLALNDKGDLEAAIGSYKKALKINPYLDKVYNNMGNALNSKGDLEAAIKSYKQAIKIKPDYAEAWSNLTFPLQTTKLQTTDIEELLSTINPKAGSKYAQIAKSVLSFSLYQGGGNAESALNEVCSLLSKADNKVIRNPKVTTKESFPQIIGPNKTVALVHFGRSGTGLLHSLIDGHPEVSTMPSIYFSEFFDHSTWDTITSGGWSEMADRFIATYEVLFDASAQSSIQTKSKQHINYLGQKEGMANVGDQRHEVLRVDKAAFRAELQCLMDLNDHLDAYVFFKLVHMAYDKALKDHNLKNLMFYHIHNPDNFAKLNFVQSAPHANWVMMVREPIQACESWVRSSFHNNKYTDIPTKIIIMLFEIDNIIYHKQRSVGVRLEDLKEFPRKTIPALCDWMGIEETESLYEMTAQGKKWWGVPDSPDYLKDGMEPFGTSVIRRKVGSVFSEDDQFILRTLFYPFSVRFGYIEENVKQFKIDLQAIRPMLNRMFDFEITIMERTQLDSEQFMKSGSYLYLRSGLIERWNVLAEFNTYPNMIKPLKIKFPQN